MSKPENVVQPDLPAHGAAVLLSVTIAGYNVEIEDEEGFIGDKASKSAFWELVDKWRKPLKEAGEDPLGDKPSEELSKRKLADLLSKGDPEAAGMVQGAIEDFAQQLATVIRRFLRLKEWRDTECIVVGGGFRGSRLGELAIARSGLILRAEGVELDLEMIHNAPNEAGLLGAAHLLPAWMLKGNDGILAVDIGGTNIRAVVVHLNLKKSTGLAKAAIVTSELWRHGDEATNRESAVERLKLQELFEWSRKNKIELAPVVGIGCPGTILEDGSIDRGGQNLPNLPFREQVPNDAVVQGLSELPYVRNHLHWGVLTIGTGLGNALPIAKFRKHAPNSGHLLRKETSRVFPDR